MVDWITAYSTQFLHISCPFLYKVELSREERAQRQGDVPYYGANGQVGWIDDYIFNEDLVLLAEDGGNFEQYATRPIAYRISGKAWVNNHAHVLRAREGILTNAWLFNSLSRSNFRLNLEK